MEKEIILFINFDRLKIESREQVSAATGKTLSRTRRFSTSSATRFTARFENTIPIRLELP